MSGKLGSRSFSSARMLQSGHWHQGWSWRQSRAPTPLPAAAQTQRPGTELPLLCPCTLLSTSHSCQPQTSPSSCQNKRMRIPMAPGRAGNPRAAASWIRAVVMHIPTSHHPSWGQTRPSPAAVSLLYPGWAGHTTQAVPLFLPDVSAELSSRV